MASVMLREFPLAHRTSVRIADDDRRPHAGVLLNFRLLCCGLYFMPVGLFQHLYFLRFGNSLFMNEGFSHCTGDIVVVLHRWRFHQIGTGSLEGATEAAIKSELDHAHGVDD